VEVLARLLPEQHHRQDPLALISRIELHATGLELCLPIRLLARLQPKLGTGETVEPDRGDPSVLRLSLAVRLCTQGGRTEVIGGVPATLQPDPVLIRALRSAHALLTTDRTGTPSLEAAPATSYNRKLIRLAFLAPDLQSAILDGRQPGQMTLGSLMELDIPLSWTKQRQLVGIAAPK
jgi:site-specific DNA recombinase